MSTGSGAATIASIVSRIGTATAVAVIAATALSANAKTRDRTQDALTPAAIQRLAQSPALPADYPGTFRLKYGEQYLGYDFAQTTHSDKAQWALIKGSSKSVKGYAIFQAHSKVVWHCPNARGEGGALIGWNSDRHAEGDPQDGALFQFEIVDATARTVRIRNVHGSYVRYVPPGFRCDLKEANGTGGPAAIFTFETLR